MTNNNFGRNDLPGIDEALRSVKVFPHKSRKAHEVSRELTAGAYTGIGPIL